MMLSEDENGVTFQSDRRRVVGAILFALAGLILLPAWPAGRFSAAEMASGRRVLTISTGSATMRTIRS